MNLKPQTRKRFFKVRPTFAFVIAVFFIVITATGIIVIITTGIIVGKSQNLARVDTPPAAPLKATTASMGKSPGAPLKLSGALAPPAPLKGRIVAPGSGDGAFTTPFFDEAGGEVTLASLRGTGLVVNFWATWCAPCVKEMPALNTLAAQLEGSGVRVLAISEDRDAVPKVKAFYDAIGIHNLDVYFDKRGAFSRKMGVRGLPSTLLIKASGTELGRVVGIAPWDAEAVVAYLKRVLSGVH